MALTNGLLTGTASAVGTSSVSVTAAYKGFSTAQTYSVKINPENTVVLQSGGYRTWLDGSAANSCNDYLNPSAGNRYTGDTGTGIYRVNFNGTPANVYCDMVTDGGGWMLTMHAVANVTSTSYDLTLGQVVVKGAALKTATQDSAAYPVVPTGTLNNYNQVLFKGGNSTWTTKMGTWIRFSTFAAGTTSISTTYNNVLTQSGRTTAYINNIGWGAGTVSSAVIFSLWDVAGLSTICGGAGTPGGRNCPEFSQVHSTYIYHYDTSTSRELYVR